MRSGSRASQRRHRRTGSHSGGAPSKSLLSQYVLEVVFTYDHYCLSTGALTYVFLFYRSKTYVFEEFLFTWQDRLRKLERPTAMSVKLQAEVDKYKVVQLDDM